MLYIYIHIFVNPSVFPSFKSLLSLMLVLILLLLLFSLLLFLFFIVLSDINCLDVKVTI